MDVIQRQASQAPEAVETMIDYLVPTSRINRRTAPLAESARFRSSQVCCRF